MALLTQSLIKFKFEILELIVHEICLFIEAGLKNLGC